jgi:phosphohistidine phosphatase
MRHAQAEGSGPSDLERPLTASGRDAAAAAGRWLAGEGFRPERALVSAATRTLQTWAAAAEAAGWTLEPEVDRGLYAAGPDSALDLVNAVPDEVRSLLVIGHNPTVGHLAQLLDDGEADEEVAGEALASGYPPATLSVFGVDGSWADVATGSARLVGFHSGRS